MPERRRTEGVGSGCLAAVSALALIVVVLIVLWALFHGSLSTIMGPLGSGSSTP